jgi:uncharacterized protein YndB with AHSA1/START domain
MFSMTESIIIHRPVAEVFAFVTDLENDPKYRHDILDAKWTAAGPIQVGRTFEHLLNFMGRQRFQGRISQYQPNHVIEIQYLTGSVRPTYQITFEPSDTGTKITHRSNVEILGWYRLLEPMMPRMGKARLARDYRYLKQLLEGQKQELQH